VCVYIPLAGVRDTPLALPRARAHTHAHFFARSLVPRKGSTKALLRLYSGEALSRARSYPQT
jgi:hypothetical protein